MGQQEIPTAVGQNPPALPLLGPPTAPQLHVMSFNMLFDHEPPPRTWAERRLLARRLIAAERPSLLGTQECLYGQVKDLKRDLGSYDYIYMSTKGNAQGLSVAIFFDATRLEPLDFRHLWLSDTPDLVASRTWGNEQSRMASWVRFADTLSGKEFVYLNTHFDHAAAESRDHSAQLIRDVIAEFDVPTIASGDFNSSHESQAHQTLIDGGLVDTWTTAERRLTDTCRTFNNWDPTPQPGNRIDWILSTPDVTTHKVAINTWTENGNSPSDHWPVQALISLD